MVSSGRLEALISAGSRKKAAFSLRPVFHCTTHLGPLSFLGDGFFLNDILKCPFLPLYVIIGASGSPGRRMAVWRAAMEWIAVLSFCGISLFLLGGRDRGEWSCSCVADGRKGDIIGTIVLPHYSSWQAPALLSGILLTEYEARDERRQSEMLN